MNILSRANLPQLPLLLWKTPPGLELILSQEGVPFQKVQNPHAFAFQGGRFVLFDGRRTRPERMRSLLTPDHIAVDVDTLRSGCRDEPFDAIVNTEAARRRCLVAGVSVHERIARFDQGAIRERMLEALRETIFRHGGIWARLARFPYPYRSAFGFRADLDEPYPRDFERFARGSEAIADCTTLFVSTRAYGRNPAILRMLGLYDTQSHGHNHVVYRDEEMNLLNLRRAHETLHDHNLTPTAFAAPEGRWNEGLDRVMEAMGYEYSSDFQLSYDDLPFFPWRDGRFSRVLQVPIHPICEGLFLDAGITDLTEFSSHFRRVVRAKIDAGEPAFLYGHPERRLGRYPKALDALIREIEDEPLLWRVPMTMFARWWRWRTGRRWSLSERTPGLLDVQFEDSDATYPLGLEILRGQHVAILPLQGARTTIRLDQLAFEKRRPPSDRLRVLATLPGGGMKEAVKSLLDWETVTPIGELPSRTLRDGLKRRLRRWRSRSLAESAS